MAPTGGRTLADAYVRIRALFEGFGKDEIEKEVGRAGDEAGSSFSKRFAISAGGATAAVAGIGVTATAVFGGVGLAAAGAGLAIAKLGFNAILAGEQMKKTWEKFGTDVQKQFANIAKPLQPVLTNFMTTVRSTLTQLTPALQDAFKSLAPALNAAIGTIGKTIAQLGPTFASLAKSAAPFIQALGEGLADAMASILPAVAGLFENLAPMAPMFRELVGAMGVLIGPILQIVGAFAQLGGPLVTQVVGLLANVLSGLAGALVPVLQQLGVVMQPVIKAVSQLIGAGLNILGQLIGMVAGLFVQLYKALSPLIPVLLQLALDVFGTLIKALQPAMPMIGELVAALGQTLLQAVKALMPGIQALLQAFVQLLPALLPLAQAGLQLVIALLPLVPAIATLASTLITALLPVLVPVIEAVAQLATQIIQLLVPAVNALVKWLVGPLVGALQVAISWLADKLQPVFQAAAGWLSELVDRYRQAFQWIVEAAQGLWSGLSSAFSAVVDAAQSLWSGIQSAWNGITSATSAVVGAVTSVWNGAVSFFTGVLAPAVQAVHNVTFKPVMDAIAVVVRNAWVIVENVFKLWIAFMDITWGNAIRAAGALITTVWTGIRDAIQAAWNFIQNSILQPALNWITSTWNTAWTNARAFLTGVWTGIRDSIQGIWNFIRDSILAPAANWVQNTFGPYWTRLRETVTSAWNGLRDAIQAGWNFIRDNIFNPVVSFITQTIPNAFRTGVSAIGQAWNDLKEMAAAPVRWVIDVVINRGIIDSLRTVTKALGHEAKIEHLPGFAEGGPLPGPRRMARRDNMIAWGPNGPLALQSGEYVMPTDRTAKYYPILESMRKGTYPGYADGGIIGDIISGVSGFFGDVVSLFSDPLKTIINATPIGDIVSKFGDSPFVQGLKGIPEKIMEAVVAWFNDNKDKLISGDAGKGTWNAQPFGWPLRTGNQPPWASNTAAAASHMQAVFPGQSAGSYVSPYGWSDHFPKAIDLMTNAFTPEGLGRGNQIVSEAVRTAANFGLKYIIWNARFTQGQGWVPYSGTDNPHTDHVHLSYYRDGGPITAMARGGTIPEPIMGVGRSGRRYTFGENGPETVLPNGAGINLTINVEGSVTSKEVAMIERHVDATFNRFLVQLRKGKRT